VSIYIREAHPKDGFSFGSNNGPGGKYNIVDPTTLKDRIDICRQWMADLECLTHTKKTTMHLVDGIGDDASIAFGAWPERLYVIEDGMVSYRGGEGPFGYKIDELAGFLESKLGA